MAFDPKDALNAAKDVAAHAVGKSAEIVEGAGKVLKGDIAGGVSDIVADATEIATHAVGKAPYQEFTDYLAKNKVAGK